LCKLRFINIITVHACSPAFARTKCYSINIEYTFALHVYFLSRSNVPPDGDILAHDATITQSCAIARDLRKHAQVVKRRRRNGQYALCILSFANSSEFLSHPPFSTVVFRRFFLTMANETCSSGEVMTEAAKTANQLYKIHNQDDFSRITKGIKVARCMQSPSTYGKFRAVSLICECIIRRRNARNVCLFIFH